MLYLLVIRLYLSWWSSFECGSENYAIFFCAPWVLVGNSRFFHKAWLFAAAAVTLVWLPLEIYALVSCAKDAVKNQFMDSAGTVIATTAQMRCAKLYCALVCSAVMVACNAVVVLGITFTMCTEAARQWNRKPQYVDIARHHANLRAVFPARLQVAVLIVFTFVAVLVTDTLVGLVAVRKFLHSLAASDDDVVWTPTVKAAVDQTVVSAIISVVIATAVTLFW